MPFFRQTTLISLLFFAAVAYIPSNHLASSQAGRTDAAAAQECSQDASQSAQ